MTLFEELLLKPYLEILRHQVSLVMANLFGIKLTWFDRGRWNNIHRNRRSTEPTLSTELDGDQLACRVGLIITHSLLTWTSWVKRFHFTPIPMIQTRRQMLEILNSKWAELEWWFARLVYWLIDWFFFILFVCLFVLLLNEAEARFYHRIESGPAVKFRRAISLDEWRIDTWSEPSTRQWLPTWLKLSVLLIVVHGSSCFWFTLSAIRLKPSGWWMQTNLTESAIKRNISRP